MMPSLSPIRASPVGSVGVRGGRRVVQNGVAVDRPHVLAVVAQTRAVVLYLEPDAELSGLEAAAVSGRNLGERRVLAVDVDLLDVRTSPDRQPVAVARVDPRQRLALVYICCTRSSSSVGILMSPWALDPRLNQRPVVCLGRSWSGQVSSPAYLSTWSAPSRSTTVEVVLVVERTVAVGAFSQSSSERVAG